MKARRLAMIVPSRAFLESLLFEAIAAVQPAQCLAAHLPPMPKGRLIVLAAGKAASSMTEAAEVHYEKEWRADPSRVTGVAVTRHGYGRPTRHIQTVTAGHPMPDDDGLDATSMALDYAARAGRDDLVLVLLSGGASANWVAPASLLTLQDKQAVTLALLRSGASISEINTVRKHLSRIKGGRLAVLAQPAKVVTLAISDVPHDDPAVIGSGPTVPDPTTLDDARAIIGRYGLSLPPGVSRVLADPASESPKPSDSAFEQMGYHVVARAEDALRAAVPLLTQAGYEVIDLGAQIEGEARDVAAQQAQMALDLKAQGRRAVILSGGELTVTIRGHGKGGPNQEFALALAIALQGEGGICAIAADTDGTDGGMGDASDPAGAVIDAATLQRARSLGLDPAAFLADNDSGGFFAQIGGLMVTGPTYTNVNDFRAIVVDTA
jgi:glycerate 2-kinase